MKFKEVRKPGPAAQVTQNCADRVGPVSEQNSLPWPALVACVVSRLCLSCEITTDEGTGLQQFCVSVRVRSSAATLRSLYSQVGHTVVPD